MSDSPPVAPDAILPAGQSAENAGPAETSLGTRVVAELDGSGLGVPGRQSSGVGDSPARNSLATKRAARIAQADAKVRRRAQRVEEANGLAPYIDDTGKPLEGVEVDPATGRPKGWSAVTHQIAKDSRRPIKVQPGYISQQLRVAESYRKAEADKPQAPTINAEVVNMQINTYAYPVRTVDEE